MAFRLVVSVACIFMVVCGLAAGAFAQDRPTAWRALVERDAAIADDTSVDWRQRLILHLLNPRQAEAYFSGQASAEELILSDGRTLAAALDQPAARAGGVYVPLPVSCRLFATFTDDPGADGANAERSFRLGELNLSGQGGSSSGCPVAPDAMAAVLQIRAQGLGLMQPRLKLWAEGLPEPASAAMERGTKPVSEDGTATVIVNLCAGPECGPAALRLKSSHAAAVEADLIGYFRPLSAADRIGAGPILPLATEGSSNNFFGTGAGANTTGGDNSFFGGAASFSNTTGFANSFFGRTAGISNTTGDSNSFFGGAAGFSNTTGFANSFFGRTAGISNTVEDDNTFIGAFSNGAAGIANATALGHRAQVSQSNSLVLGNIAGLNEASGVPHASVNVGIGTPAPQRQLHLAGSNATFRMDRDQNTAAFILVRTNSSGTPLKAFVVGANASGANNGEFIINDLGQAIGGAGARRMTITSAGETHFTGTVRAPAFAQTSSLRYKSEVETVQDAVGLVSRLRGVSFTWKETGKPSLGLIAEEAAEVVPELVVIDENSGQGEAVNYAALIAVLIEAVKEQQERGRDQQGEIESQRARIESQQAEIESLRAQLSRLETQHAQIQSLQAQLVEMQSLLSELLGGQERPTQLVRAADGR